MEAHNTRLDKLGGRKFVLGLLGLVVLTVLGVVKPEAISASFITGLLGIVAAFNVSNVTTTVKTLGAPSTVDTSAPLNELQENVKVDLLYLQSQVDVANQRVEAMANIIEKSLTPKQQYANMDVTRQSMPESVGTQDVQALANRQAIDRFLKQSDS